MSNCQLFIVRRNGDVELFREVGNALGSAFLIWKSLSDKYKLDFKLGENKSTGGVEKLVYNTNTPLFERIALVHTFEGVWVKRENMPALINALEDFVALNLSPNLGSTLQGMTTALRQAFLLQDVIGVALNQTSGSKPFWFIPTTDGVPATSFRVYNMTKDTGHFELFEELNLISQAAL